LTKIIIILKLGFKDVQRGWITDSKRFGYKWLCLKKPFLYRPRIKAKDVGLWADPQTDER